MRFAQNFFGLTMVRATRVGVGSSWSIVAISLAVGSRRHDVNERRMRKAVKKEETRVFCWCEESAGGDFMAPSRFEKNTPRMIRIEHFVARFLGEARRARAASLRVPRPMMFHPHEYII